MMTEVKNNQDSSRHQKARGTEARKTTHLQVLLQVKLWTRIHHEKAYSLQRWPAPSCCTAFVGQFLNKVTTQSRLAKGR